MWVYVSHAQVGSYVHVKAICFEFLWTVIYLQRQPPTGETGVSNNGRL